MAVSLIPRVTSAYRVEVSVAWGADPNDLTGSSWSWTDITTDVRMQPGLAWRLGRADEASRSQPAQLTLELLNPNSAYSLGGHSPNWPNVKRGTPVRVRISIDSGATYTVAFAGFADGWTPSWDSLTGKIAVVRLSASGTLRRLAQGNPPVRSTYRRGIPLQPSVVAYVPMEDGLSATQSAPAVGPNPITWNGTPKYGANTSFACSDAILDPNGAIGTLTVPGHVDNGADIVRFLLDVGSTGLADGTVLAHVTTAGGSQTQRMGRWDLVYAASTNSAQLYCRDISGSLVFTMPAIPLSLLNEPSRISLQLIQSGTSLTVYISQEPADNSSGYANFNTFTNTSAGVVTKVELGPIGTLKGVGLGHLTVQNSRQTAAGYWDFAAELIAFVLEGATIGANYQGTGTTAGRTPRLCAENGIPYFAYGATNDGSTGVDSLGPQRVAGLVDLLNDAQDLEQGALWDGLDFGLAYTSRRRRENASAMLTLNMAANLASFPQLAAPFAPVDDDQRTCNRATYSRRNGGSYTYEDVNGDMGTAKIRPYEDSQTVASATDAPLSDLAGWRVAFGTIVGYRYPSVTIDLTANPSFAAAVLGLYPGARIDITNLSTVFSGASSAPVSLIVEGINHTLDTQRWKVTLTCSPYQPWRINRVANETGDSNEYAMRLEADGVTTVTTNKSTGNVTLPVTTTSGPYWSISADDYPTQLEVDGVLVNATACSGAGPAQTFTVDPLPMNIPAGSPVRLWNQTGMGI